MSKFWAAASSDESSSSSSDDSSSSSSGSSVGGGNVGGGRGENKWVMESDSGECLFRAVLFLDGWSLLLFRWFVASRWGEAPVDKTTPLKT